MSDREPNASAVALAPALGIRETRAEMLLLPLVDDRLIESAEVAVKRASV